VPSDQGPAAELCTSGEFPRKIHFRSDSFGRHYLGVINDYMCTNPTKPYQPFEEASVRKARKIGAIVGGIVGGFMILLLMFCYLHRWQRARKTFKLSTAEPAMDLNADPPAPATPPGPVIVL
jgi:hypothetical protein